MRGLLKAALAVLVGCIVCWVAIVVAVDPFFHYHKPLTNLLYYRLPAQDLLFLNDGILRHFDYEGLLIGTSMVENTDVTPLEEAYDARFVKAIYPGATFGDLDEAIRTALDAQPHVRVVVRSPDTSHLLDEPDRTVYPTDEMPAYLYDTNPLNDAPYVLSWQVLRQRCVPMLLGRLRGASPGIDSFDQYGNWMASEESGHTGAAYVLEGKDSYVPADEFSQLEPVRRAEIDESIEDDVLATIRANPQVEFVFYIPPYGITWWMDKCENGTIEMRRAAEEELLSRLVACENVRVFGFQNLFDVTTNLDLYRDRQHFTSPVNELMLQKMEAGEGLLTKDSYRAYLDEVYEFYESYDYAALFE